MVAYMEFVTAQAFSIDMSMYSKTFSFLIWFIVLHSCLQIAPLSSRTSSGTSLGHVVRGKNHCHKHYMISESLSTTDDPLKLSRTSRLPHDVLPTSASSTALKPVTWTAAGNEWGGVPNMLTATRVTMIQRRMETCSCQLTIGSRLRLSSVS